MLALLTAHFSCVEKVPQVLENTVMTVEPTNLKIFSRSIDFKSNKASSQKITVTSTNVPWEFTDVPDWITINPMSGPGNGHQDITISCTENTSVTNRMGVFLFRSTDEKWNYSTTVSVSQARGSYYANPEENTVSFEGSAGSRFLRVDSNTDDWKISVNESLKSWCTVVKEAEGVHITVDANIGITSRTGEFLIYTQDSRFYVTVIQRPANIIATVDTVHLEVGGGSKQIPVTSEAPWTAETSYSWIDVSPGSAEAGSSVITVMATQNNSMSPRTGLVYLVLSDENKIEIPVTQDGIFISVDYDNMPVSNKGANFDVTVKSNSIWQFVGNSVPSWIELDTLPTTGDKTVTLKIAANPGINDRLATIYVTPTGVSNQIPINVRQRGITLESDSTALHFSDKSGMTYMNVISDVSWTIETSATWITISRSSGTGNAQISVSVTENTSDSTRTGYITVVHESRQAIIPVYQTGKYLNVSSSLLNFASNGGETVVSIKSNNSWTATCGDTWVNLSATSGTDDCNITITVDDNASAFSRSSHVLITPSGLNPVRIVVNQAARHLELSPYKIEFFSKGGTSTPVIVTTDGAYEVTTGEDWITITKESDTQFTITASEYDNDEVDRSGKVIVTLTDLTSGAISKEIEVLQKCNSLYDYVDLGLSVNWAKYNVGASSTQEYGDSYSWGMTTKPEENYGWDSYEWCKGTDYSLTKYCVNSSCGFNGYTDGLTVLEPQDDVAYAKWGGKWRMPTKEEWNELRIMCTWTPAVVDGMEGFNVKGPNGNTLFLANDCYWTSSLSVTTPDGWTDGSMFADLFYLDSYNNYYDFSTSLRCNNYNVRPVFPSAKHKDKVIISDNIYLLANDYVNGEKKVHVTPRIISDPSDNTNKCVVITTNKNPSNNYDGQLFIVSKVAFEAGDVVTVSFKVKADEPQSSNTEVHSTPGEWISSLALGSVPVTTEWTTFSYNYSVNNTDVRVFAIDLSYVSSGNNIYFDNVYICNSRTGVVSPDDDIVATGKNSLHDYVDLGLSVKWAMNNMGASTYLEYGSYYAWGETEQYCDVFPDSMIWHEKDGYSWSSYSYCNGFENTFTKYCTDRKNGNNGFTDNKTVLDQTDDAASAKWGYGWRMPTNEELDELLNNCKLAWTSIDGVMGIKATSSIPGYTDRSIFLPFAGHIKDKSLVDDGSGLYWSTSLSKDKAAYALNVQVLSSGIGMTEQDRYLGLPIRPVFTSDTWLDQLSIGFDQDVVVIPMGDKVGLSAIVKSGDNNVYYPLTWSTDDSCVAIVDKEGVVTGVKGGDAIITVTCHGKTASCKINVVAPGYVDMGLSVMWATFNVGAVSPEQTGYLYSWGEIESKSSYSWSNYKWNHYASSWNQSSVAMTKYCTDGQYGYKDFVDDKRVLELVDDAAYAMWGGDWRMPTREEMQELLDENNCQRKWTTQKGVNGYLYTSKKEGYEDRSIFIPVTGKYSGSEIVRQDRGYYWTSTLGESNSIEAYQAWLGSGVIEMSSEGNTREIGAAIRPVRPSEEWMSDITLTLDYKEKELFVDYSTTLTVTVKKGDNIISVAPVTWASLSPSIASVNNSGEITGLSPGTAKITATCYGKSDTCTITVTAPEYEYVDLGLSVRWATFNIGAASPEESGNYYAWAETTTKDSYSWSTYKYCDGSYNNRITKYCIDAGYGNNGFTDNKTVLDPEDDVARVKWGQDWRMPTVDEWQELCNDDNCLWTWSIRNGIKGLLITSKKAGYTNRSIFLPATGYRSSSTLNDFGSLGFYSSASLSTWSSSSDLIGLQMGSDGRWLTTFSRENGYTVRPVNPFKETDFKSINFDIWEQKLIVGGQSELNIFGTKLDDTQVLIKDITWSSSDESVATVIDGIVTGIGTGTCSITASLGSLTTTCPVTVKDLSSVTPEYVDLGLSVKWASFNVGAYSPEMSGDYYAWGETEPYYESGQAQMTNAIWKEVYKEGYYWNSYRYSNGSNTSLTKYCSNGGYGNNGFADNKTSLEMNDDVAHEKWGGSWRMPTIDEILELINNCKWTWTIINGIKGYQITSRKTGYENNSIFLPASGFRTYTSLYESGVVCSYWSRDMVKNDPYQAVCLYTDPGGIWMNTGERLEGKNVRPVCPFDDSDYKAISINQTVQKLAIGGQKGLIVTGIKNDDTTVNLKDYLWTLSDESVLSISDDIITAIAAGSCTVTATFGTHTATCTVTVIDPSTVTPEYVDLGLSVKWATFNVGAYSPDMYGDYYAWGDTEPYYQAGQSLLTSPSWRNGKSNGYEWSSYKYCQESSNTTLSKYCNNGAYGYNGYTDNKTSLDLVDDVAHVEWGGNWRIPTSDEFNELINNCTRLWTEQYGVNGYLMTSNIEGYTDRSIFLPAAGCRFDQQLENLNVCCYYWTSSLYLDTPPYYAHSITLRRNGSSGSGIRTTNSRSSGFSVRPVYDPD